MADTARYLGYVDFQGIAFGVATILLVAYVVPYLYRRRMVLAEARIEERYAEDLRILEVPESRQNQAIAHRRGPHGTVFFRQPEVIMSQSDKAQFKKAAAAQSARSNEVRALAKERARRRARISKRQVNRQRGMLGAGVLVGLCIVLWVLVGVTSLSAIVAGALTGVCVVYLAGFGYIVNKMATATAQDEEAIEKINRRLKSNRGSGRLSQSRGPGGVKGANRPQSRAEIEKSARPGSVAGDVAAGEVIAGEGDAIAAGEAVVSRDSVTAGEVPVSRDSVTADYRGSGIDREAAARVEKLLGSEAEKASQVKVNAQWPRPAGYWSDSEGSSGEGRRSGLVMSLEPEIIEDSINVDVISSASASRANTDLSAVGQNSVVVDEGSRWGVDEERELGVARELDERRELDEGRESTDVRDSANAHRDGAVVEANEGGVSQDAFWEFSAEESPAAVSPVAVSPAVASSPEDAVSAVAQPVIADPYAVVADPYAALPRSEAGESRGAGAGAGESSADSEVELPSYTAKPRVIERRVVTPYESPAEPEAAVPYRPKEIGERFDNEVEGGDSSGNVDGLLGGSSLDALLDRRRA